MVLCDHFVPLVLAATLLRQFYTVLKVLSRGFCYRNHRYQNGSETCRQCELRSAYSNKLAIINSYFTYNCTIF